MDWYLKYCRKTRRKEITILQELYRKILGFILDVQTVTFKLEGSKKHFANFLTFVKGAQSQHFEFFWVTYRIIF